MTIASGTSGTCTWSISDAGALTVRPTSGSSGYFVCDWMQRVPWYEYANRIVTAAFSGNIRIYKEQLMADPIETGSAQGLFSQGLMSGYSTTSTYPNLTRVSGINSLTGVKDCRGMFECCPELETIDGLSSFNTLSVEFMDGMFSNCSKLTTLDLSSFDTSSVTRMGRMFNGCSGLTSLNISSFNTSNVTGMSEMFCGCSKLTALDVSSFNTSNVTDMFRMFTGCTLLTSVTFGNGFDCSKVVEQAETTTSYPVLESGFGSGKNNTNGITVQNDEEFAKLTASERQGTWRRGVVLSFEVSAYRTSNGTADEDGEDATLSIAWATNSEESDRTVKIYKKLASTATYPSTADVTQELSGDSGTTVITLSNIGENAYDFKVTFYDGESTFVAFPSIQSNIRLVTIDNQGRIECNDYSGNLKSIFDIFYPVGSYYETSDANFNPNTAWGGTWYKEIEGQVHISSGSTYSVSGADTTSTVGSETRVGTNRGGNKDAIVPYHNHGFTNPEYQATGGAVGGNPSAFNTNKSGAVDDGITGGAHTHSINGRASYGGGGTYIALYKAGGTTYLDAAASKTHTHDLPNHTHSVPASSHTHNFTQPTISLKSGKGGSVNYAGTSGNATNANLQPYVVVHRWHRIA